MKHLLTIREYEEVSWHTFAEKLKKSGNQALTEKQAKAYFTEFLLFVKGKQQAEVADAEEYFRVGYRKNVGDTVKACSYVGIVQLASGLQIEILPKVYLAHAPTEKEAVAKSRKVFLRMLQSLRNFDCKLSSVADLDASRMSIYEIFIWMYVREVQQLVRHGLSSDYLGVEENSVFYKGKLKVSDNIRLNLAHAERFYVEHDEYRLNRAENRLIKATLQLLYRQTCVDKNRQDIYRLFAHFEQVQSSVAHERDFGKVRIDRNSARYVNLMAWSKVFLFKQSFTNYQGANGAWSMLFPMEKLFESYVGEELRRIASKYAWQTKLQDRGKYLFDASRIFALKPDIVLYQRRQALAVLDTKWKQLCNDRSKKFGVSQQDMYQMYAYAHKYGLRDIWLLYPKTDAEFTVPAFESRVFTDASVDVRVHIAFIALEEVERSLTALLDDVRNKIAI